MAPLGRFKLRTMLENGLPRSLQHPLEFLFGNSLTESEQEMVSIVESIRQTVARRTSSLEVLNREGKVCQISPTQMAKGVSIDPESGTFLFLCSEGFRARTILELGSGAGISGCHLASSAYCERFITVEASPNLASLARENIRQVSNEVEVVNALFDQALDKILPNLKGGIDLAFIDGHHKYEATLHYLRRLEPHLNKGGLVVFDDIHLSRGMWQAWQVIKRWKGFRYTIGAGRFGLCLWEGSAFTPVTYNLCPYLGCFRPRLARSLLIDHRSP